MPVLEMYVTVCRWLLYRLQKACTSFISLSLSLSLCRYLACSCIDHLFLVGDKSTRSALGRSVERLSNDRINHSYTRVCPETAGSRLFEKRDIGLKVDRFGLPSFAIERYSCVASLASFVACAVARMEK